MINKYTINRKKLHDMTMASIFEDAVFCVDAENNRFWFESYGGTSNECIQNIIENIVFNDIDNIVNKSDYSDDRKRDDIAFCKQIKAIKDDITGQIIKGLTNNIKEYKHKLDEIDKDYIDADSDLTIAIKEFQSKIAEYLDNDNIYTYGWGDNQLLDITKSFVHFNSRVNIEYANHTVPIEVCFSQAVNTEEKIQKVMGSMPLGSEFIDFAKVAAEELFEMSEYYLCHDQIVNSGHSLYKIAQNFNSYEEILKDYEQSKYNLAKEYVESLTSGRELSDTFSDEFKDLFGYRPRATEDYEMLANLYEQGKQSGDLEPDIDEER